MTHLVFVHGWGFDASFWDGVLEHLPKDISTTMVDLGYTGQQNIPEILPKNAIAIGHSLGVMWLLKNMKNPQALISFSGFDCFFKHIPLDITSNMRENLDQNLDAQMNGFYKACGSTYGNVTFKKSLLKEGLSFLENCNAEQDLKPLTCPIHAMASEGDIITPLSMMKTIWSPYNLIIVKGADHALPLNKPESCATYIKGLINAT